MFEGFGFSFAKWLSSVCLGNVEGHLPAGLFLRAMVAWDVEQGFVVFKKGECVSPSGGF